MFVINWVVLDEANDDRDRGRLHPIAGDQDRGDEFDWAATGEEFVRRSIFSVARWVLHFTRPF